MLLMSGLLRPLYKGGGGAVRPAGGPLNVHTNVPLTAQQTQIPKNTPLILLSSQKYPKHAFAAADILAFPRF